MNRNQENNYSKLNVSILTSDIANAKSLSDALRDFGIFAHYFRELDELWVAANNDLPDLVILDIKNMSQGKLVFKNHPRVVNDSMKYVFFYNEDDKFLLNSTYHLPHLGYIRKEVNIKGQVEAVLNRVAKEREAENKNQLLQARIGRLQKRSTKLVSDINESVRFHENLSALENLIQYVEENAPKFDFNSVLCKALTDWDAIKSFGIYELNQSGQKLVGHNYNRAKYHILPQLWLGRTCNEGIEEFAQEMATQVAVDIMGGNVRTLALSGEHDNADILILAEINEDEADGFNFGMFEKLLSGIYRKNILRSSTSVARTRMISPWESLTLQDEMHYHQRTSEVKLVNISFTGLINQIKLKFNNRFYWKAFYQDFLYQLDEQLSEDTCYSEYGVHQLLIFCENERFEADLNKIKNFVQNFSYWRYFEDSGTVLASEIIPQVKLMPASSIQYLRHIDQDFDDMESSIGKEAKRASEIIQRSEL